MRYLASFSLGMIGPEGEYILHYDPHDNAQGSIRTNISGVKMTWIIEVVDQYHDGITLSGMTTGSTPIWQNQFWFVLFPETQPPRIEYWGNQVLWRIDICLDR